jgi:hypothetical protein
MCACRLAETAEIHRKEVDLVVADGARKYVNYPKEGGKLFCDLAMETGNIYSRVLMNFLGIYRRLKSPSLVSRGPRENFQNTEVWIERFPGGRLLSVHKLLTIRAAGVGQQKMYWHVVRSLQASNTETAHLTHIFSGKLRPNQMRVDSLYYTCWLARKQVLAHFYRKTLKSEVPPVLLEFDNTPYCVPEA